MFGNLKSKIVLQPGANKRNFEIALSIYLLLA